MASRWANPESRTAAMTAGGMALRSPVINAAATAPAGPSRLERTRWAMCWRTRARPSHRASSPSSPPRASTVAAP